MFVKNYIEIHGENEFYQKTSKEERGERHEIKVSERI